MAKAGKLEVRCDVELLNKYKQKAITLGTDHRKLTIEVMKAIVDDRLTINKSAEMKNAEKVFK